MRQLLLVIVACSIGMSASAQNGTRTRSVYAPSACADVALPRSADSLDKLVIARMHEDRIPAVQLSVLRRGRLETRVYGYADLDHCVPADSNTIFGIGSVSKQLTAYATLRLVQSGSIALDDPITKYLPEARPMWDGITIMTPGFGSFAYGALRARFRGMSAPALAFLGCDDLRYSKPALPDLATSECYYRLGSDHAGVTLGVYFTDAGAVADVRVKG